MATYTDIYHQIVTFTDGEAFEATDLTRMQLGPLKQSLVNLRFSGVCDAIGDPTAIGAVRDLEAGSLWNTMTLTAFTDLAFAPYPSCGYVRPTVNARELECVPGPLLFSSDPEPFNDGGVYAIRLRTNTFTTAVGDATNPRIDLVEIKVDTIITDSTVRNFEDGTSRALSSSETLKTEAAEVTIQIKQGTPSATPAYPTPTSGFVALAAVYVPATHNAVHSADNIRDMRMPLGAIVPYDVYAHQIYRNGPTPWLQDADTADFRISAPSSASPVYAMCPVGSATGRLVGIGVHGESLGSTTCKLKRVIFNGGGGGPGLVDLADLREDFDAFDSPEALRRKNMVELMNNINATGTYKGTRVTNTRVGTPIWCNGFPAGVAYGAGPVSSGQQTVSHLAVELNATTGSTISLVRFYVAHGL